MSDPFEALVGGDLPIVPRLEFAVSLRRQLDILLQTEFLVIPHSIPQRKQTMTKTVLTPYLAVHDASAALAFYASAFGAHETMRVAMDDGRVGHAELYIGGAKIFLADEFPEIGVVSPRTLGGTVMSLHLEVDDVDGAFARAVREGATAVAEPADQPHGARHGTLVDPFGHRWMLSQSVEVLSNAELGDRYGELGAELRVPRSASASGGIWAALNFADAVAGIRFAVDVLGFEEQLVVPGDEPGVVVHSELRWPEGGVVQAATADRAGNVYSARPIGSESLYVITADPLAVYTRCVAAGAQILAEPSAPHYDPAGLIFSVRDQEGNIWAFGTYTGEA